MSTGASGGEGNAGWQLGRKPTGGWPQANDFHWFSGKVPEPASGQVLTRTLWLSLDPYQWGRRRRGDEAPGDVCHGRTVSQVIASRHEGYNEGDFVFSTAGWQRYGLLGEDVSVFGYMFPRPIDPAIAPISTAVGILGMLGLTAWSGVRIQCDPRPGETVIVSAASGGVGQAAGQIARQLGCRVVGIAGTPEKCAYVTEELGFDACIQHSTPDFPERLAQACPAGADVYFENVGGAVWEAVLPTLNPGARVSLCGLISQYGNTDGGDPFAAWQAVGAAVIERQQVQIHKLFVGNFVADYQDQFLEEMAAWVKAGSVRYREDVRVGLENAPGAFADMLAGGNFGKTLVAVHPDPTR